MKARITLMILVVLSFFVFVDKDFALSSTKLPNAKPSVDSQHEVVSKRSRNTRVWEKVGSDRRVIEKGCGICYRDLTGTWQITETSWRKTEDGFVMDKANFSLNVGLTAGSIMTYDIGSHQIEVKPVKLVADNGTHTAVIATIDDSIKGTIVSGCPNKLLFSNAFGNGVDLEIEANPEGYHQNVIFREKPVLPAGFDVAKTKLKLYTQMDLDSYDNLTTATVKVEIDMSCDSAPKDELLSFSSISGPATLQKDVPESVAVVDLLETGTTRDNIRFVEYYSDGTKITRHTLVRSEVFVKTDRQEDPEYRNITTAEKQFIRDAVTREISLVESIDAAVVYSSSEVIVWDYHIIDSTLETQTWQSGETYYITSYVSVGTDCTLTIEPGAVVKFDSGKYLSCGGGYIIAQGSSCQRIIFTSEHDDKYGEIIDGSTGEPEPGDYSKISLDDYCVFEYCNVFYAGTGIDVTNAVSNPSLVIKNNYFASCDVAVKTERFSTVPYGHLRIFNNLISSSPEGVRLDEPDYLTCGIILNDPCNTLAPPMVYLANNTIDGYNTGILVSNGTTQTCEVSVYNSLFTHCKVCIDGPSSYGSVCSNYNAFQLDKGQRKYKDSVSFPNPPTDITLDMEDILYFNNTYYLDQNSELVDGGADWVHILAYVDLLDGTFTTDFNNNADESPVDIGYHYNIRGIWYVDCGVGQSGDGTSWETAFKTIQEGIDAACDGDIVKVADGIYIADDPEGLDGNHNLHWEGKHITVSSENGPENCIIRISSDENEVLYTQELDPENEDIIVTCGVFYLYSGQDSRDVIRGFTITGYNFEDECKEVCPIPGITCEGASSTTLCSPVIENCIISYCNTGIYTNLSGAKIDDCQISHNFSTIYGGGVSCKRSPATIEDSVISNNFGMNGGGIGIKSPLDTFKIYRCLIIENVAVDPCEVDSGGGISAHLANNTAIGVEIYDCIVSNNFHFIEGLQHCYASAMSFVASNAIVYNCTISDNFQDYPLGAVCVQTGKWSEWVGKKLKVHYECSDVKFENCIVTGNESNVGSEYNFALFAQRSECSNSLSIANSNISGGSGSITIIGDNDYILDYDYGSIIKYDEPNFVYTMDFADYVPQDSNHFVSERSDQYHPGDVIELFEVHWSEVHWSGVYEGGMILTVTEVIGDDVYFTPAYVNVSGMALVFNWGQEPTSFVGDYHLLPSSKCIDEGANAYADRPTDIDGDDRIMNGTVDMGADEYISPVAHWKLDETEGLIAHDSSVNNYDGTLCDDFPTDDSQWVTGQINGALKFDGYNDYVSCPFVLNPNDGPFSAFAWVMGGGISQHIICQLDGTGTGRLWFHVNAVNNFTTQLREPGGSGLSYTAETWDSQKWNHVGIVWDGLRRHLYIDGEEVIADGTDLIGLEDCDGSLYIGAHKDLTNYWDGLVDDVRIYDRALSEAEIENLVGM